MTQPLSNPGPWTCESAFPVGLKEPEGRPPWRTGPRCRLFLSPVHPWTHCVGDRRCRRWESLGLCPGSGPTVPPTQGSIQARHPEGHRLARGAPSQSTVEAKGPVVLGQPCGRREGPRPSVPHEETRGRAVTRPMGPHGMRSTQDSAQQQAWSTQRGAWTGTPHQPRRGPPGTHDRTQSRACPWREHGMRGPLCMAHTCRCHGQDGAGARANPPTSARRAAGAQRDPKPVPPWAPRAGLTALPQGWGGGGDRSELLSPLLRIQAHPSTLRGCEGRGQELRGRNS